MSVARVKSRMQVCCDTCPARYPNTYAAEDFNVMISDARTAGWQIRKAPPARDQGGTSDLFDAPPRVAGAKVAEPFTHTCPSCAGPIETGGLF